jgi:hypothetical protein
VELFQCQTRHEKYKRNSIYYSCQSAYISSNINCYECLRSHGGENEDYNPERFVRINKTTQHHVPEGHNQQLQASVDSNIVK